VGGPSLVLFWGHTPLAPAMGALPPWTPVGFGLASVLGPTRGGVANAGCSPLLLNLWGDTPHDPPPWGLRPLDPLYPPP